MEHWGHQGTSLIVHKLEVYFSYWWIMQQKQDKSENISNIYIF